MNPHASLRLACILDRNRAIARGDRPAATRFGVMLVDLIQEPPEPVLPPLPVDQRRRARIQQAAAMARLDGVFGGVS